jgi:hypothetical protein
VAYFEHDVVTRDAGEFADTAQRDGSQGGGNLLRRSHDRNLGANTEAAGQFD